MLTNAQWRLIEPILPSPSPSDRGRPPLGRRAVLDGILWKFRTDNPWYDMPPDYPPYQTCYRCHRKWARHGVMQKIYNALFSAVLCPRPLILTLFIIRQNRPAHSGMRFPNPFMLASAPPARGQLHEIINSLPGLRLGWYDWWLANSVLAVAEKHQIEPSHANWLEAFPFTIVGELPDEEKVPPRVPGIMDAEEARRVYGDGSFGGRYQVEGNIMQEVFEAALLDILKLLKFE